MIAQLWLMLRKIGLYLLGEDPEPTNNFEARAFPPSSVPADEPDVLGEIASEHVESIQRRRSVLMDDSHRTKRKFVGGGLIEPEVDEVDRNARPRPVKTRARRK